MNHQSQSLSPKKSDPNSLAAQSNENAQPPSSKTLSLDQQSSSTSCREPLSPLGKEEPKERKAVSFDNMTRVVLLPVTDVDVGSLFYNEKEIEEFRYDVWLEERGLSDKGMVTKAFKFVLRVI